MLVHAAVKLLEHRRIDRREPLSQSRKHRHRSAQLSEIAWSRGTKGDPRKASLDIAHGLQQLPQTFKSSPIDQRGDRLVTCSKQAMIRQRPIEAASQATRAHRGDTAVEQRKQSGVRLSRQTRIELKIAARSRI